jgi:hypothetical protein
VFEAELEGDAAEDERQQHQQHGEIDRRNDDGERHREHSEQRQPAEDQPRLVAIPDWRDRAHDGAALALRCEAIKDADAKIEAVQHHIEEHADADDRGPDRQQIGDAL